MEDSPTPDKSSSLPRVAIAIAGFGLLLSFVILYINHQPAGSTKEVAWDTTEAIKTPEPAKLGNGGSIGLIRTTISAIAPNASGESLFRIAGLVKVNSGSSADTTVRCSVAGNGRRVLDDYGNLIQQTSIARTPKLRAAWPRPSGDEDMKRQDVPENLVVKFKGLGAEVLYLNIRDSFRRFTDSIVPVTVDWDTDPENTRQTWVWHMPQGTGASGAGLGYAVVFKSIIRPTGTINCSATAGKAKAKSSVDFKQDQWPIPDAGTSNSTVSPGNPSSDVQ